MSSPGFVNPTGISLQPRTQLRAITPRQSSYPTVYRMPPKATIAAPSDPARTSPESEEETTSVPWMPLPGLVHEIKTPEQFDRLMQVAVEQDALLVADFMARWCRKCLYLLPKLKKLGVEFGEVFYCSVDVNAVRRLPKEFGIEKMPTFLFLRGGGRLDTVIGGGMGPKVVAILRERIERFSGEN